ncbi:MAG: Nif3-like dinuclear metal center hexameric protein [Chitinophagaceae bacterium]
MQIATIISALEQFAPIVYQESYDNAGLITGNAQWNCTGIICNLDATEAVIDEAIEKKCNLVIAHHPIIFSGLKKINGNNYIEKTIIKAIKNDIAIYAIHTNLDNIIQGVNAAIAEKLQLINCTILFPKNNILTKLCTYVPLNYVDTIREAIFCAGGGNIGNYGECSFSVEGIGTFNAGKNAQPFVGEIEKRHEEKEMKVEIIFPSYLQNGIVNALKAAHPYEEVAYDLIPLSNQFNQIGSGIIGQLEKPISEKDFLTLLKQTFGLQVIKHTSFLNKSIETVAICGGAGSFLINKAMAAKADIFITADMKYHEFFDANERIVIADIGHWESEQFTTNLLIHVLQSKFPTFAVLKSEVITNPVQYFL